MMDCWLRICWKEGVWVLRQTAEMGQVLKRGLLKLWSWATWGGPALIGICFMPNNLQCIAVAISKWRRDVLVVHSLNLWQYARVMHAEGKRIVRVCVLNVKVWLFKTHATLLMCFCPNRFLFIAEGSQSTQLARSSTDVTFVARLMSFKRKNKCNLTGDDQASRQEDSCTISKDQKIGSKFANTQPPHLAGRREVCAIKLKNRAADLYEVVFISECNWSAHLLTHLSKSRLPPVVSNRDLSNRLHVPYVQEYNVSVQCSADQHFRKNWSLLFTAMTQDVIPPMVHPEFHWSTWDWTQETLWLTGLCDLLALGTLAHWPQAELYWLPLDDLCLLFLLWEAPNIQRASPPT